MQPTKRTNFRVIEDGIIQLEPDVVASVQIPTITFEMAEHVEANHIVETPTLIRVENYEIKLYESRALRNNWWLSKIPYNQDTGAFLSEVDFEFALIIELLLPDLITPYRRFTTSKNKAKSSAFDDLERTSTDNLVRTITLSPVRMLEVPV